MTMMNYIGTKIIKAKPMNRQAYNDLRHWQLPTDENGDDDGYLVEYTNGGQANHEGFTRYISWSPKAVFEKEYKIDGALDFSGALKALKQGLKVMRNGWNGKNMFLFLVNGSTFKVNRPPLLGIYPEGTEINYHAHIDMRTADGQIVPWLASQTDMLAEDWAILH